MTDQLPAVGERDSRRRERRVVVIVAVGALAMIVGVAIGRSGSRAQRADRIPSTTLGRTNLIEPIPTVDPPPVTVSVVTSSAPPMPTTASTTASQTRPAGGPFIGSAVGVATPLAGQPIEIVAIGNGRRLLRVDLATGQYRDQAAPVQPFGRPQVLAIGDELVFPSSDPTLPASLLAPDGAIRDVDLGSSGVLLAGPSSGLWSVSAASAGQSIVAEPISSEGVPLGPRVELTATPVGFDPAGGFVVEAVGGAYSVDERGADRITAGRLVALGATVAVATECDESLNCAVVEIERATGERVVVTDDPPSIGLVPGATVSADRRAAIVEVLDPVDRSSSQPTLGVFDLMSGDLVELGPAQNIDEAVWSPDGRFVLFNRGGRLVAYDRTTGDDVVVADELIAIDTFVVRPSTAG